MRIKWKLMWPDGKHNMSLSDLGRVSQKHFSLSHLQVTWYIYQWELDFLRVWWRSEEWKWWTITSQQPLPCGFSHVQETLAFLASPAPRTHLCCLWLAITAASPVVAMEKTKQKKNNLPKLKTSAAILLGIRGENTFFVAWLHSMEKQPFHNCLLSTVRQ